MRSLGLQFKPAIEVANKIEDESVKIEVLVEVAKAYMDANQSLELPAGIEFDEVKLKANLAVLQAIAEKSTQAGEYTQALERYGQALQILEIIDVKNLESTPAYQEFIRLNRYNLENHSIPLLECALEKS